jgi:predicted ATPase
MKCPHYFTASDDTGHILISWNGDEPRQIFIRAEDVYGKAAPRDVAMWLNKAANIGFDARAEVIKRALEIK